MLQDVNIGGNGVREASTTGLPRMILAISARMAIELASNLEPVLTQMCRVTYNNNREFLLKVLGVISSW